MNMYLLPAKKKYSSIDPNDGQEIDTHTHKRTQEYVNKHVHERWIWSGF